MRRCIVYAAALLLALSLTAPALADSWQGVTAGADTVPVTAPCAGTLTALTLTAGQRVTAGETVGEIALTPVYAPCDGRIVSVLRREGERADSAEPVLQIEPVGRYRVLCTVSGVAKTVEDAWIRCGETLWMKCTADGSHRAAGRVIAVSGMNFEIETTAGELYIGEAVWVSRDEKCNFADRIGKGTVTAAPTESVSAEGVLFGLRAEAGAFVRRGQLLFRTAQGAEVVLRAPADGVVTEVRAEDGATVAADETVAVVAASVVLRVSLPLETAVTLAPGDCLRYMRADDPHGVLREAEVIWILTDGTSGTAAVELAAEEDLPVGMSVIVTDDEV
ncbi:MAG: HlyD family efflux transporter periplasmic adaptor subunit [Clostridia bacterium]|nr:HlyD family efflux transporter periplasmic adaptor subunit [Clostridia bacterium]